MWWIVLCLEIWGCRVDLITDDRVCNVFSFGVSMDDSFYGNLSIRLSLIVPLREDQEVESDQNLDGKSKGH